MDRNLNPMLRDGYLSSLVAFLNSENMVGKRQYITEFQGLEQMSKWICLKGEEEEEMFHKGT